MTGSKNRYTLRKTPYLILIAGLTAVAADAVYIAAYAYSLPPDELAASVSRIRTMIEYVFASLTVLTGGALAFDCAIKEKE